MEESSDEKGTKIAPQISHWMVFFLFVGLAKIVGNVFRRRD